MPLPGGGRLHARRRVRPLADGLTWIEEEMQVAGRMGGPFATGPGWIFEVHSLLAGSVSYVHDGVRAAIEGKLFGLLFAPYSVTELHFEDVTTRWVGVAGQSDAMGESLVLGVVPDARPTEPAD